MEFKTAEDVKRWFNDLTEEQLKYRVWIKPLNLCPEPLGDIEISNQQKDIDLMGKSEEIDVESKES